MEAKSIKLILWGIVCLLLGIGWFIMKDDINLWKDFNSIFICILGIVLVIYGLFQD